ncbi:MAG: hypothetical protein IJ643_04450 [Eubacterium sp.]|nr:hypothetical protein [Eubacterium sp.]
MKKLLIITLSICMVVTAFSACSKEKPADSAENGTQAVDEAKQDSNETNSDMAEPTSVDGSGSKLTGDDYSFTAFGTKYTLGKSTLQDFLDNGWAFDKESDSMNDPETKVDSYTYATTANLVKDGSTIYRPRFVNFSKSGSKKLSECKLLQYTINFSGKNILTDANIAPSKAESFELPLGINADYNMATTMKKIEESGLGHYEQDYDTYYTLYSNPNYDDADNNYTIEAQFDKNNQKIHEVMVEIGTYTDGEFDEQ